MRRYFWLLVLCLLLVVGLGLWFQKEDLEHDPTILEIKKQGGTVAVDRDLPGPLRVKVSFIGPKIADSALASLHGLSQLHTLYLYGTKISNAAVDVLKGMKNLRTVDLRYTRMTRAAVDRLLAAAPKCSVEFLDASPRQAVPAQANRRIAADSNVAVAEWVAALDGKAIVVSGWSAGKYRNSLASVAPISRQLNFLARVSDTPIRFNSFFSL